MRQCYQYGTTKIQLHDQTIQKTIIEGLCNLVFLEVTSGDLPQQPQIHQSFDQLLTQPVIHALSQETNLQKTPYQHPYQHPHQRQQAITHAYYHQTPVPMNIRLHPDELDILIPFDLDEIGHLYYQWQPLVPDSATSRSFSLLVDTGNHAVSGMSLKYFQQIYLSQCPSHLREKIIEKVLDRQTPEIPTCGVGGRCQTQHIGYVELTFRLVKFPKKGNFTIDCDVNDTDLYDLLIGDRNKPESKLPYSNMQKLLTENKILLQYQVSH